MRNTKNTNIKLTAYAVLVIIIIALFFMNRDTEANEPKDYSFMSKSATTIDDLEVENNEYRKQKEELNLIINTNKTEIAIEQCKLDKRDEKAICTSGLK